MVIDPCIIHGLHAQAMQRNVHQLAGKVWSLFGLKMDMRLGERFYRVDRSRSRESGGIGLGLAITKHLAQRHGGELQISSQQGRGSVFALVFPAQRVRALPPPAVAVSAA